MEGLGERIRVERKARKLRLQTVADRSGLTPSFLSQVERSLAVPSLSSLALIAQALGVDMRAILPPAEPGPGASRHGARVPFGPDQAHIAYERLSTALDGGSLSAVKLRVSPGYRSEVSSHEGEEFVYVLSGTIRYVVAGVVHDLAGDDAMHFSSAEVHHVENVSDDTAEYISIGTFNVFGPAGDPPFGSNGRVPAGPNRIRKLVNKGTAMSIRTKALMSAAFAALALGAATAPARAERLLTLDQSAPGEIDPAKGSDYSGTILATNLYDTLVYPKKGAPGVEPLLADSWTQDGLTYTFKLHPGVTFHSGNPLTADDVVFSLTRLLALGQGASSLLQDRIAKVEAIDPTTVRFTLKEPFAPFLAALVRLSVVDAKTVMAHKADGPNGDFGDYGAAYLSNADAGSGAYTVTSQNPVSETDMAKFPGYFRGFAANAPDKVRMRYGIEASTVRALMSRGEQDIADPWLPPEVVRALAAVKGLKLLSESGATGEYIKMNTARPPLDDVHCRIALTYAFDYDTSLKILKINGDFAQGTPINGAIPSGLIGYDDAPAFKQDMSKAQAELKQCKHDPKQSPIDVSWIAEVPARERIALLMQASFQKLGFPVKITRVPWALLTDQVTKPDTAPHLVEIAVSAMTPDADSLLYNMYSSKVPATWMSAEHLKDDKVDTLLDQGRAEADPAKREAIYKALNARLRELAPTIFAYQATDVAATRDAVKVPAMADAKDRYLDNFNLLFREMSVAE